MGLFSLTVIFSNSQERLLWDVPLICTSVRPSIKQQTTLSTAQMCACYKQLRLDVNGHCWTSDSCLTPGWIDYSSCLIADRPSAVANLNCSSSEGLASPPYSSPALINQISPVIQPSLSSVMPTQETTHHLWGNFPRDWIEVIYECQA